MLSTWGNRRMRIAGCATVGEAGRFACGCGAERAALAADFIPDGAGVAVVSGDVERNADSTSSSNRPVVTCTRTRGPISNPASSIH